MAEQRSYNYEGMFVISQSVAVDLQGAVDHIKEILTKNGASLIAMKKWDERRFAYEIDKQKRGVYLLVYFTSPAGAMTAIDRATNLSEKILRHLFIRADHLSLDEMKAADAQKELEVEAKLRAQRAAEGITDTAPESDRGGPAPVDGDDAEPVIDAVNANL